MPGAKSPVPVPAGEATSIPVHKEHIPCFHIDFAETWGDGGGGLHSYKNNFKTNLLYTKNNQTMFCI